MDLRKGYDVINLRKRAGGSACEEKKREIGKQAKRKRKAKGIMGILAEGTDRQLTDISIESNFFAN